MRRGVSFVSVRVGRRAIPVVAGVAAVLLSLFFFGRAELRAASPALSWSWRPSTESILLTARPGKGLLRDWVWGSTRWAGGYGLVSRDPRRTEQVRPGEDFRALVSLRGPDVVARRIELNVAPLPTFSVDSSGQTLEITSSQPLDAVWGIPGHAGPWAPPDPTRIVLDEAVKAQSLALRVQAASGERTTWHVAVPALPTVPVIWFGAPEGGNVYITLDDGWYPNQRLLKLMRTRHIPITAFLIENAVAEHLKYWRAFVQAGGVVEDHTVSHPELTTLSFDAAEQQWAGPLAVYPKWLGAAQPTLGRPPYGAVDPEVEAAAHAAGLKAIVMWDVVWTPGAGFKTWNGGPIQAGDIILLHWVPGVGKAIQHLLPQLAKENLHPAPLTSGLPSGLVN